MLPSSSLFMVDSLPLYLAFLIQLGFPGHTLFANVNDALSLMCIWKVDCKTVYHINSSVLTLPTLGNATKLENYPNVAQGTQGKYNTVTVTGSFTKKTFQM